MGARSDVGETGDFGGGDAGLDGWGGVAGFEVGADRFGTIIGGGFG